MDSRKTSPFFARYADQRKEVERMDHSPGPKGHSTAETLLLYEIIRTVRRGLLQDYAREPQHQPAVGKPGGWKPGGNREISGILGLSETTIRRAEIVGAALLTHPELQDGQHHTQEEVMRLLGIAQPAAKRNIAKRDRKVSDGGNIWRRVLQEVNRQLAVLDGAGGVNAVALGWTREQRRDFRGEVNNLLERLRRLRSEMDDIAVLDLAVSGRSQWDT